jgi:hypothetical protein
MTEYGNTIEPGIVTNVSSVGAVSTSGGSPSDVALVGQADLVDGNATAGDVYQITSGPTARNEFGTDSPLTTGIIDALEEGAYPVYAVAATSTSVTGEDLSTLTSNSGTLSEGVVSEDADEITFTINSTTMTTVLTFDDPSTADIGADEVYVNPATREFQIDPGATIGNTGDDVDYNVYDYSGGIDSVEADAGDAVDFVTPLSEDDAANTHAQTTVGTMADEYNFAMAIVGAGPYISDPVAFSNNFDDSRVLTVYPSRNADGESTLGSYAGLRASLGISTTPINKRLATQKKLSEKLNLAERGSLIEARVVPMAQESSGARIADDVNTVSDDNSDEANIRYGFSRLVVDAVLETVRANEQPFIGRLNAYPVRKAFEGLVRQQLRPLSRSNAVLDYTVRVQKVDATTARLELSVDTAEPIRFIKNDVSVGNSS